LWWSDVMKLFLFKPRVAEKSMMAVVGIFVM
jgi:hypothetical protein